MYEEDVAGGAINQDESLEKGTAMNSNVRRVIGFRAVLIGLVVCPLLWSVNVVSAEAAKKKSDAQLAAPSAKPASQESAPAEKIAYTFDDEAKMKEFTHLWQQRQTILLRMTVLQSYWGEEQAALAKLNNQLAATYHLDATKNYSLDSARRVLIEREGPRSSPPATPAASSAEAPSQAGQTAKP